MVNVQLEKSEFICSIGATRGSVEGAKFANSHAGLAVETGSHCC